MKAALNTKSSTVCLNRQKEQAVIIRKATLDDIWQIYQLYKIVAQESPGNLTQEDSEITWSYVQEEVNKGLTRGLILVLENQGSIIGYLKAFTSEFGCQAHVLTNATMMLHPFWQNQGYGGQLIEAYLTEIQRNMPHILRFELLPHQSNQKAICFYERHGFVIESKARQKIRNQRGNLEAEVTMVWFNPNFGIY
ncbi:GNAT family N-acetyltransferase [Crocosphaera sp. XPORK-15E]|uniref:GNAT family N-acetyltransferase n=1 Tax=Crocosphaera sp. XPORK-15E TaxID=3110247 RepID=UPI002B206D64|nr:GNAT family N-acetyltransferase [Crocosphaera sp. XPORK-15E]MEA5536815.1 GNAT family N-acetyltransferase [Crocosphaera sp. XPORK-15E]